MGGKALNRYGVFTERKNTEEFTRIGIELKYKINMTLNLYSEVATCYRNKADHGDLDLLIKVPNGRGINWKEYIQERFEPQAINANGGVFSFDYKDFQIDLIPLPSNKWDTAITYFSYDPLGNIMGKVYHKFGLSYGWEGLYYKFRNFNGINSQNILISNDIGKIFEFGGYDYDRYLLGFDSLDEIFDYCINSKYFDAEMFEIENLKAIDRKRNRKRGSYHAFLNYIKDKNINNQFNFNRNKDSYLPYIENFFPEANLKTKLEKLVKDDEYKKSISFKFNGNIIMEWMPEIKGKELGNAISKFKKSLGDDFNEFINNSDNNTIFNKFMDIYNNK